MDLTNRSQTFTCLCYGFDARRGVVLACSTFRYTRWIISVTMSYWSSSVARLSTFSFKQVLSSQQHTTRLAFNSDFFYLRVRKQTLENSVSALLQLRLKTFETSKLVNQPNHHNVITTLFIPRHSYF